MEDAEKDATGGDDVAPDLVGGVCDVSLKRAVRCSCIFAARSANGCSGLSTQY